MPLGVAGALLAATGLQAAASLFGGRAEERRAERQAGVLKEQAARDRELTEAEVRDFARNQSRFFAERRAALGASGIDPDTGTPVLAAEDFATEVELQKQRIRMGGEIRSTRAEQQASLLRQAGRAARRAGVFRAGASLLTGIGMASEFVGTRPPPDVFAERITI